MHERIENCLYSGVAKRGYQFRYPESIVCLDRSVTYFMHERIELGENLAISAYRAG